MHGQFKEEQSYMANEHNKRCSNWTVVKEMQSKAIRKYLFTAIRLEYILKDKQLLETTGGERYSHVWPQEAV